MLTQAVQSTSLCCRHCSTTTRTSSPTWRTRRTLSRTSSTRRTRPTVSVHPSSHAPPSASPFSPQGWNWKWTVWRRPLNLLSPLCLFPHQNFYPPLFLFFPHNVSDHRDGISRLSRTSRPADTWTGRPRSFFPLLSATWWLSPYCSRLVLHSCSFCPPFFCPFSRVTPQALSFPPPRPLFVLPSPPSPPTLSFLLYCFLLSNWFQLLSFVFLLAWQGCCQLFIICFRRDILHIDKTLIAKAVNIKKKICTTARFHL